MTKKGTQAPAAMLGKRALSFLPNGTDEAAAQLLDVGGRTFSNIRFFGYAAFNPAQPDIVQRADARGAPGELEFFAPSSRMAGYYGDPEATRQAFTGDGFYRSGDLGYTLDDGRFVFLTRMGDALRLGGFLVSPAEIEATVQEVPGIAACQVVAIARAEGLVPVAFVILREGAALDEAAVIADVASRLARYKVPRRVFPIDAFPVTPGANATKIQKGKLREMAEALLH